MKKIILLFLSAILVFSFCGCDIISDLMDMGIQEPDGPANIPDVPEVLEPVDPNWPVTAFGAEISAKPEKVAVASPALAEYISDMGYFEKVCAVPEFCGFDEAAVKPKIGSVRLPDLEAIKSAEPEYILTFAKFEESVLVELQQMNITVICMDAPMSLDELRTLYKEIALFFSGAVDGITEGENYVAEYDSALSALAYSGEKKTAGFIRALDYMMITGGTFENEILSAAGIINVAENYSGYVFPEENWKEFDPDVIFLNPDIHLIDLETSDLYKKKTAVKNDRVYNVDIDAIGIGSKRSLDIIKDVLATVYGDYSGGTAYSPAYPSMYQK